MRKLALLSVALLLLLALTAGSSYLQGPPRTGAVVRPNGIWFRVPGPGWVYVEGGWLYVPNARGPVLQYLPTREGSPPAFLRPPVGPQGLRGVGTFPPFMP